MPFAFTEHGVAQLFSVLNSEVSIEVNIQIIRAFIAIRQLIYPTQLADIAKLWQDMKNLKVYVEEAFTGYNDINENTRMQLELINQALAELQVRHKEQEGRKRPQTEFIKTEN